MTFLLPTENSASQSFFIRPLPADCYKRPIKFQTDPVPTFGAVRLAIVQINNPNEKNDAEDDDCKNPEQSLTGTCKFVLIFDLARGTQLNFLHLIECLPGYVAFLPTGFNATRLPLAEAIC